MPGSAHAPAVDTILLKVASRCNINCSYCYVYHLGDANWARIDKRVSAKTMQAMVESLDEVANRQKQLFAVVLHGGEPLLLGPENLKMLFGLLREKLPDRYPISIQTNGTLITREILDLCSHYRISMAVSIDGPENANDRARLDHKGLSTYTRAMKGIQLLQKHKDAEFLYAGLLAVIDPRNDPAEIYRFFKRLAPPSINFLYKDGNHSKLPPGETTLDSVEFGLWRIEILRLSVPEQTPRPIRVLDDMLKLIRGGYATKEGNGLSDYGILIFDTDGSIAKNDTLKSAYEGADRFANAPKTGDVSVVDLLESEEYREYHALQQPTARKCLSCQYLRICGGGMTTHRWSDRNGYDNPTVYCADQMRLIDEMLVQLKQYGVMHDDIANAA